MLNRLFAGVYALLLFLPLYIIGALTLLPHGEIWMYLGMLFGMMLLGLLFGRVFRKQAFYATMIGFLIMAILTGFMISIGLQQGLLSSLAHLLAGLLTVPAYLMGERPAVRPWYETIQGTMTITLLALYAVIMLFVGVIRPFGNYGAIYTAAVILAAVVGLFAMNRFNIAGQINRNTRYKNKKIAAAEAKDGGKETRMPVSPSLFRHNLALVALVMILVLVINPLIGDGLTAAGQGLVTLLNYRPEEEERVIENVDYDPGEVTESEPKEPGIQARKFADVVAWIGVGLFGALLLFVVFRKGRDLLKRLLSGGPLKKRKKKEYEEREDELYEEIVESIDFRLFGGRKLGSIIRERIGFLAMKNEEERVRYLFRSSVRKATARGYRRRVGKTAFEILGEIAYADGDPKHERAYRRLADAYNSTRYDAAPPADGTAARIREELRWK